MDRQRDAVESATESALEPGRFIARNQEGAFVADLEEVERDVALLTDSNPSLHTPRLRRAGLPCADGASFAFADFFTGLGES